MPKKYSRLPWTRTYRKLPQSIENRLAKLDGDFVVACVQELKHADLEAKRYEHLNIRGESDVTSDIRSFVPSPTVGRTSYLNAIVEEKPRKDIGKIPKTILGSAPNPKKFGGRHSTVKIQPVWPKSMLFPDMSQIAIRRIPDETGSGKILVHFQIQETFNAKQDNYRVPLLRCINLLQENGGKADLFASDAKEAEYIRRAYQMIGWEPLAGITKEDRVASMNNRFRTAKPEHRKKAVDRLQLLEGLRPMQWFSGSGHFTAYLAAQFGNELVVFENLDVGAIYVMRANWETLSRLSRSELLANHSEKFVRILHTAGWETRLAKLISETRGDEKLF